MKGESSSILSTKPMPVTTMKATPFVRDVKLFCWSCKYSDIFFRFFLFASLSSAPFLFPRVCSSRHVLKATAKALKRAREQATIQRKRDFEQLQRSKVGKPLSVFLTGLVAGGVPQSLPSAGSWLSFFFSVTRGV